MKLVLERWCSLVITISVLLLLNMQIIAQDYINSYNGIPLFIHGSRGAWFNQDNTFDLSVVKEMGGEIIFLDDINQVFYDPNGNNFTFQQVLNSELKLIPIQINAEHNYISFYSESSYSIWKGEEAENVAGDGVTSTFETAVLYNNTNIGQKFYNKKGRNGVKTIPQTGSGTLIYGPGYLQQVRYSSVAPKDLIEYKANFSLLLDWYPSGEVPEIPLEGSTEVCTLFVVAYDTGRNYSTNVVEPRILTIADFQDQNRMNTWIDDTFILSYNFAELGSLFKNEQEEKSQYAYHIEYQIKWSGQSDVQLYFDKVTLTDQRSILLLDEQEQIKIRKQAQDTFNVFTTSGEKEKFDTTVVSFFGIDEPYFIDKYEPIKIIDGLINSASNGKRRLYIYQIGRENGKYISNGKMANGLYIVDEFIKRAQLFMYTSGLYIFDFPKDPSTPNYREQNIESIITGLLERVRLNDANFIATLPFYGLSGTSQRMPEPKELLYITNLGLLYGAKGLSIYNYFGTTNLIGIHNLQGGLDEVRYNLIKDVISPRLKGLFGKTLKHLQPTEQFAGINIITSNNFNKNFIKSIENSGLGSSSDTCIIEIGFFNDNQANDNKYFIALNRYYSNINSIKFTFKDLSEYNNWTVFNFNDTLQTYITANINNEAVFTDVIQPGDGKLYGLIPTIITGGTLNADETISTGSNITVNNTLTVAAGKIFNN